VPVSSSARAVMAALGHRLRGIREDTGLTQRDLAARLEWHSSKLSKIEHGKQMPTAADITSWCVACNAQGLISELVAQQRAVHEMFTEWRRMESSGLAGAQGSVVELWERTQRFHAYDAWMIPGPFQTRNYTETVLRTIRAMRSVPVDDVAEAVEVRMRRQGVLHMPGKGFAVVIEESVLHYCIVEPEAMIGQLGHLLTVSVLPNVSFGIIPMDRPRRRWPVEGFWMFDERRVDVELVSGWLSLSQPQEVSMYRQAFMELSALAVHGANARSLIAKAIKVHDEGTNI
jgi:transcriptional regulator with XRE-family HTH domain